MSTTPSAFTLGQTTQSQILALPELAPGDYVNTAGVPDTKEDCNTRANAVYPRFLREFIRQTNNVFLGTQIVPGIATVAGKSWRPSDDGGDTVSSADFTALGIEPPSHLWHLNGIIDSIVGGLQIVTKYVSSGTDRDLYSVANARGGVNGEAGFVYGARSCRDMKRYSSANLAGIGQTMAFGVFVSVDDWNRETNGIVIASHRAYDRADEAGAYRLGFEIGIGRASATDTADELALYYRHVNASNVVVERRPITGGGGNIAPPLGREFFIGFTRTASTLDVYLNGLLLYSTSFGAGDEPSPGTAPEMRLMLGGDWDGTRYLNGFTRNVVVWTGAQPTGPNILNYYRAGGGFI